jgi:hypothetical protein
MLVGRAIGRRQGVAVGNDGAHAFRTEPLHAGPLLKLSG